MFDSDISKYKRKVLSTLTANPEIIEALEGDVDDPDSVLYTKIFPYLRIPGTTQSAGRFITMKLDSERVHDNDIYKTFVLTLCAVVHQNKMETKWRGTATDVLGGLIVDEFNKNNLNMGFELKLVRDSETILTENYHVRELVFSVLTSNSVKCGEWD